MKLINNGNGDYTVELTQADVNRLRTFAHESGRFAAKAGNKNTARVATWLLTVLCNSDVDIDFE